MQNIFSRIIDSLDDLRKIELTLRGGRCSGKTLAIGYVKGIENSIMTVKQISKEYKDDWVPCSSGVMPEILQWVIIQTVQDDLEIVRYLGESECWGNDFYHRIHPRMVVAWRPLPELYKQEETMKCRE